VISFIALVFMFTGTAINQISIDKDASNPPDTCINSPEDIALKTVMIISGMLLAYMIGIFLCTFHKYCVTFKSWIHLGGLLSSVVIFGLIINYSLVALEKGSDGCGKDDYAKQVRYAILCASAGLFACLIYLIFVAHNWYRGVSLKPGVVVPQGGQRGQERRGGVPVVDE
jgi:hypothetical protein